MFDFLPNEGIFPISSSGEKHQRESWENRRELEIRRKRK